MASIFTPHLSHFPLHHKVPSSPNTRTIKVSNFNIKRHNNTRKTLPFVNNFRFQAGKQQKQSFLSSGHSQKHEKSILQSITNPVLYVLFCIAIGFLPFSAFPARAAIATVANEVRLGKKGKELNEESDSRRHEYWDHTRRLLEEVSRLLNCIEDVKMGKGGVEGVRLVLKDVKAKKEELQEEIMDGLYKVLRELKRKKETLMKRVDEIVDEAEKMRRDYGNLGRGGEKDRLAGLEERMMVLDEEYSEIWERVGEIEDEILRRETVAMSVGVRELCFIERECEELVKRFNQEMRLKSIDRYGYNWTHY